MSLKSKLFRNVHFVHNFTKGKLIDRIRSIKFQEINKHIQRMKESLQEENRRKTFYDGLGSKYKGETTEIKPFNLTDEREGYLKTEGKSNSFIISQKLGKSKHQKLTPGSRMMKISPNNTPVKQGNNFAENVELKEDKYAKPGMHYTKKDYAKIKVHKNTDLSKQTL